MLATKDGAFRFGPFSTHWLELKLAALERRVAALEQRTDDRRSLNAERRSEDRRG